MPKVNAPLEHTRFGFQTFLGDFNLGQHAVGALGAAAVRSGVTWQGVWCLVQHCLCAVPCAKSASVSSHGCLDRRSDGKVVS